MRYIASSSINPKCGIKPNVGDIAIRLSKQALMKSTKTTIRRKSQARAPSFSNALAGKQWLDEQKAAERKARKASKTPNAPTVPTRQVTTLGDLTRSVDKQAAKKAKKFVKKQAQNANTTSQHSSSGATGKNTTSSPTSGRLVPAKPPTKALGDRILIKRTGYHPVTGADDETDPAILALQARKRPNHPWTQQVKADDARMDAEDKAQHDAIVADGTLPTSLDISSIQLNFKQRGQAQEAESAVDTLAAASNEHPPPTSSTQDVAQVTSTGPQEGPETNWEDEHDLGCQKCRQAIGVFDQKTTLVRKPTKK